MFQLSNALVTDEDFLSEHHSVSTLRRNASFESIYVVYCFMRETKEEMRLNRPQCKL